MKSSFHYIAQLNHLTERKTNMSKNQKTKPKPTDQSPNNEDATLSQLFTDTNISMKSGNLVKNAELVGNAKFVKFRIASNKQYEDTMGNIKTNTNYFTVMVSSNLKEAFEVAKTFKKGDWVYVKGEDSTKSFDTPEGYKQTANTIFAYKAVLKKKVGKAKAATQKTEPTPAP